MGLLMGPAFALLYSLLAIPIARYADRVSRVAILCTGCIVWSGFTILSGFANDPWMLALARVGVGVGEASFQAPAYSILAAYFAAEQRGRAFAIMTLAVYFGQYLGYRAGPEIAAAYDWRTAFEVMGLIGITIAIITFIVVREPPRAPTLTSDQPKLLPLLRSSGKRPAFARWRLEWRLRRCRVCHSACGDQHCSPVPIICPSQRQTPSSASLLACRGLSGPYSLAS
jgi:MFS family permease